MGSRFDAIYKGVICFWVDKWFVSAQVWPNFHSFFSNSESICVRIRLKSGPSQGEDDFIWACTQPNCLVPRADFPHSRTFYFLVSVKRFFFIFVSTSLGVFLKRQACQGWGSDIYVTICSLCNRIASSSHREKPGQEYVPQLNKQILSWFIIVVAQVEQKVIIFAKPLRTNQGNKEPHIVRSQWPRNVAFHLRSGLTEKIQLVYHWNAMLILFVAYSNGVDHLKEGSVIFAWSYK